MKEEKYMVEITLLVLVDAENSNEAEKNALNEVKINKEEYLIEDNITSIRKINEYEDED